MHPITIYLLNSSAHPFYLSAEKVNKYVIFVPIAAMGPKGLRAQVSRDEAAKKLGALELEVIMAMLSALQKMFVNHCS